MASNYHLSKHGEFFFAVEFVLSPEETGKELERVTNILKQKVKENTKIEVLCHKRKSPPPLGCALALAKGNL